MDRLLATAQGAVLTSNEVIHVARHGDERAGQQAMAIRDALAQAGDSATAALGKGLLDILSGTHLESALAEVPDDVRARLLEALSD